MESLAVPRLLVRSPRQPIADGRPLGGVRGKFHRDPLPAFAVEFMQPPIKLRRVCFRLRRHANRAGSVTFPRDPQVRAASVSRNVSTTHEQHASTRAVVLFMLARRTMRLFLRIRRYSGLIDQG